MEYKKMGRADGSMKAITPREHDDPDSPCPVCDEYDTHDEDVDLNVLNFERFKWGGVRHNSHTGDDQWDFSHEERKVYPSLLLLSWTSTVVERY
jgi:hypothetical protein